MVAKISYFSPLLPSIEKGDATSKKAAKIVCYVSESIWSIPFKSAYTINGSYAKECRSWAPKAIFVGFAILTVAKPRWGLPLAIASLGLKAYHRRISKNAESFSNIIPFNVKGCPVQDHCVVDSGMGLLIHVVGKYFGTDQAFNDGVLEAYSKGIKTIVANHHSDICSAVVPNKFNEIRTQKEILDKAQKSSREALRQLWAKGKTKKNYKDVGEVICYHMCADLFDNWRSLINTHQENWDQVEDAMLKRFGVAREDNEKKCIVKEVKDLRLALEKNNYSFIKNTYFTFDYSICFEDKLHVYESSMLLDTVSYSFALFDAKREILYTYSSYSQQHSPIIWFLYKPKDQTGEIVYTYSSKKFYSVNASPGDTVISVSKELITAQNFGVDGFKTHILPELLKGTLLEEILEKPEVARHITKPLNDTLGVTMMVLQKPAEEEL